MKKRFYVLLFVFVVSMFVVPVAFAQGTQPVIVLPALTAGSLATIIAAIFSLAFDYFPGLAAWYDKLSVAAKRQIAAVMAILIVGGIFLATCQNFVTSNLVCTTAGAWDAISDIIYVFAIGQAVHAGTKPTADFKRDTLKIPVKATG